MSARKMHLTIACTSMHASKQEACFDAPHCRVRVFVHMLHHICKRTLRYALSLIGNTEHGTVLIAHIFGCSGDVACYGITACTHMQCNGMLIVSYL